MKTITRFIFIIALLFTLNEYSHSQLVVDGTINNVAYTGAAKDFILPTDLDVTKLTFTLRGADGGKVKLYKYFPFTGSCDSKGGEGATVKATFKVGVGEADDGIIPYGSTIRFIIGGKGKSSNGLMGFGTGQGGGGGGGGTGVIFQAPEDPRWHILAVAGGGSGGYGGMLVSSCLNTKDGDGGKAGWDGGNGNGSDPGLCGTLGDGGTVGGSSPFLERGCGGGGVYTSGGGHKYNMLFDPIYYGQGGAGSDNNYSGGEGGNYNELFEDPRDRYYSVGGFGFGGGGATDAMLQEDSGAGGGWTGGGGGGLWGRGGGGGSLVSGHRTSQTLTAGRNTSNPAHGSASYQAILNTAPVAVCVTTTPVVNLDDLGNATIVPSLVDNGSYDPDGDPIVLSVIPNTFTCGDVGSKIVELIVEDNLGAADTCTATIMVRDTTPPISSCNNIDVYLDINGYASIPGDAMDNGSSDACGIYEITVSPNTFGCGNVGVPVPVIQTVEDVNGNMATCNAMVTVYDTVPPTMICRNVTINLDETGMASITDDFVDDGSSDACGILSYYTDIKNFNCLDAYKFLQDEIPITVTLTVTDVNNNSNSCTALVTVLYSENDEDCDDVGDECDLCPNGDDAMDYNEDYLPDCYGPYFPGYEDLHPEWTCPNNEQQKKVEVCHRPPGDEGNYHQLCISLSALEAHLRHGDVIGPCIDCGSKMRMAVIDNGKLNIYGLDAYPNPANSYILLEAEDWPISNSPMYVHDALGKIVLSFNLDTRFGIKERIDVSHLNNGIYYLRISDGEDWITRKVIIVN